MMRPGRRHAPAASARVPAPTRRTVGPARSAATGTAVTASAATAGELRQPSTSSSTKRNNAAVSAADSSASARLARTCGRSGAVSSVSRCLGTTCPRSEIAAGSASSTTGICTTKIARHENAEVKSPPITGPRAAPATPAVLPGR